MNTSPLFFIVSILMGLFFSSCEQEEITAPTDAMEALEEYTRINKMFDDAGNSSEDAISLAEASTEENSNLRLTSPSITVSPADLMTFPKTITVDFGKGITGLDGIERKGKIIVTSTNWHRIEGSVHTSVFDNYYQNGNRIEGIHISTNEGKVEGNPKFRVEVREGKVTTTGGEEILFTQNTYRTRIAGGDTPFNVWDNEYLVEGKQSGTSSKGIDYTMQTIEPLHFKVVPRGVYAGILSVNVGSIENITINYTTSIVTIGEQSFPLR